MPRPTVSVVIPAYNAAAHLAACVQSVLVESGGAALEVLVVDDGSTDGTVELARSLKGVRLIRLPANGGPSRARNAGLAGAQAEFVAFLDADDLWSAGSLQPRIAALQKYPQAALVFGDCRQFNELGPWPQTQFEAGALGAAAWGSSGLVPEAYARLLQDNFITTGSVLARRSALRAVGGFAEEIRLVEDLDLWLRLARRQAIAWCPTLCLLRRRHAQNLSRHEEAMALAFLAVLDRQDAFISETSTKRADALLIQAARAREHLHLAQIEMARGAGHSAARWALKSFVTRASTRALWALGKSALVWRTQGAGARQDG